MAGKKRKQTSLQQRKAIDDDAPVASSRKRNRAPKHHQDDDDFVSPKMSQKILKEALEQQQEIVKEDGEKDRSRNYPEFPSYVLEDFLEDEEEEEGDDNDAISEAPTQVEEVKIDPEDERILEAFLKEDTGPQLTIADLIAQKIREKEVTEVRPKIDQSVIDLYKRVGKFLSRYTAGKIPKAFKFIPSFKVWEDLLLLTDPENWSPSAVFQAIRIFASNFGPKEVQVFYNLVLLRRVREDIRRNKRLHDRLYQSLKNLSTSQQLSLRAFCSLFARYQKQVLFAWCLTHLNIFACVCESANLKMKLFSENKFSGTCNLREAVIIGSVVQKMTIPALHSGMALMKLAEMEYCGTTSYFMKLFLDKKYALPYRVLDAVVAHFTRFQQDPRIMPVIWHQCLLSLVQRYKNELTKEDKVNLDRLIHHQKHYLVTPEIRRELKSSRNRGEKEDDLISMTSPMSVINKPIEEDRWDIPDVPMEED